jgi:hypothetical protein
MFEDMYDELECALSNNFFTRRIKQYTSRTIRMCAVGVCVLFTSARTFLLSSLTVQPTREFQRVLLQFGISFSLPDLNKCCIYIYLWVFWAF